MRRNPADTITLSELVVACATSERTLLKHFRSCRRLRPLAYLRRHRLNVARHELLREGCDVAVSDIATHCGYLHLGRFGADYRRLFNESPSATRKRVRSPGAASPPGGNGEARCRSPV